MILNRVKIFNKILFFTLLLYIPQNIYSVSYYIHAFKNYTGTAMQKMELIGQISSKSKRNSNLRRKVLGYDSRESMITVKLFQKGRLKLGDIIYIIEKDPDHRRYKNGLIVATGKVFSIFKTEFQGWMLKASGNFSMVKKNHFIAIIDNNENHQKSLFAIKKAEKYVYLHNYSKAYAYLKTALKYDKQNPEIYFNLATLRMKQGLNHEARIYIQKAWKMLYRFEDVNNALNLPGVYLKLMMEDVKTARTKTILLKRLIALITQSRDFFKKLSWFQDSISKNVFIMIQKKGLPNTQFQYQLGNIYAQIYKIIKNQSPSKILKSLNRQERKIFLAVIQLPYLKERRVYPKKSWDEAYLKAAIYHHQLAHDLNPLDVRVAYQLAILSYEKSKVSISRQERETYVLLTKKYINDFQNVKTGFLKISKKSRNQISQMNRRLIQIKKLL